MKLNDLIESFFVYTTNEEKAVLDKLQYPYPLSSFSEHEQFVIEGLIRKSLVIKIGTEHPKVIANEL